jgi:hypothetical protein
MGLLAFNTDPDVGSAIFSTIFLILILVVGFVLYFLPTLAARGKQCFGSVLVLNLFLGWTLIGWVVALAWAVKDPAPGLAAQAVQETVRVTAPRLCRPAGSSRPLTPNSVRVAVCSYEFVAAARVQCDATLDRVSALSTIFARMGFSSAYRIATHK